MVVGRPMMATTSASGAEVSFGDARRPEEATHVRLESFDGPLGLLLALIEQRQLDVLTVRLGELAGAYLEAVARLERPRLPLLSSFVSVCAQLILIKSRALLPRPPVEDAAADEQLADPEEELRARLLLYRRYRDAGLRLAQRLELGGLFRREPSVALAAGYAGARPPSGPPLDARLLADALAGMLRIAPLPAPPPETLARTVTLEERAQVIREALRGAPLVVLQDLLRDVRDRVVWAVTFLALLELVIEQSEPWGPIEVRARSADPGSAA